MDKDTLEAAWVHQLVRSWNDLNYSVFDERMQLPQLRLSDAQTQLGVWHPALRCISVSRKLVREKPWGVVVEVLKHEMAHQYVTDIVNAHDEAAHGRAFQQTCERFGIDPAARGLPEAGFDASENAERGRLLQRVTKLLALAKSDNQHEAQAAMSAAQKLMLKHNLEASALGSGARKGYHFRHLGKVKGRIFEPDRRIGSLLQQYFFVEVIWVPSFAADTAERGTVLEACGTLENLDMAEYVHGFLIHTAERLWREHQRSAGKASRRQRLAYQAGLIQGFEDTLRKQTLAHKEEGLIWLGDADLHNYYRSRHPRVRNVRHAGSQGDARIHGREAGRKLVLHKPLHTYGSGAPKRLEPAK